MGRIIFETSSNTYEVERSDEDILKCLQTITGIKILMRNLSSAQNFDSPKTSDETKTAERPFNSENIPTKEEFIEFIKDHLDEHNAPMVMKHFFKQVPKYGESKDQDRLLSLCNSRMAHARNAIEVMENGKFQLRSLYPGSKKSYVFVRNENKNQTGSQQLEIDQSKAIMKIPETSEVN